MLSTAWAGVGRANIIRGGWNSGSREKPISKGEGVDLLGEGIGVLTRGGGEGGRIWKGREGEGEVGVVMVL